MKQGLRAASHILYVNSCASFQFGWAGSCVPWDCVYSDSLTWDWDYGDAVLLLVGNVMVGGSPGKDSLPFVPWDDFNSSFISHP